MVEVKEISERYQPFNGDSTALIKEALTLAELLNIVLDSSTDNDSTGKVALKEVSSRSDSSEPEGGGNERLLRHYVSMGVVDRPARQGRDAIYGARHLYQYLTARRLLKQGFGLAKIAEYTSAVTTEVLLEALFVPAHRSEAELLVAAYKAVSLPRSGTNARASNARPSTKGPSLANIDPIYGMPDLLKEIEHMRYRFSQDMDDMKRISRSLDDLNQVIRKSQELGMNAQREFLQIVQDIHQSAEKTRYEVNHSLGKLNERLSVLSERLEEYGSPQHEIHERLDRLEFYVRVTQKKIFDLEADLTSPTQNAKSNTQSPGDSE